MNTLPRSLPLLCVLLALALMARVIQTATHPSAHGPAAARTANADHSAVKPGPTEHSPYRKRAHLTPGIKSYYANIWGVDNVVVRLINSGQLVRFSARVVDAARARGLADEHATPVLFARRTGAALQIPQMENVGKLRQITAVETGKDIWMVFSNKGTPVKSGDRVDLTIGSFHVENLIVD